MTKAASSRSCQKTILVVDDDRTIVSFISVVLENSGYRIFSAASGSSGLQTSREYAGEIDLLVVDLRMCGMSGIDLAAQMAIDRPTLKVLLMSGFPPGTMILSEGWHFLAKPFIPSQLKTSIVGLVDPDGPSHLPDNYSVVQV